MISGEILTLIKIISHTNRVSFFIKRISRKLDERADIHDISKFLPDEFAGFSMLDSARDHKKEMYGSKEYENGINNIDVVKVHWSRNPHHPEHYKNGISDMSYSDIIEMLCDWEAAREQRDTEEDIDKTWKTRQKRFNLSDNELYFLRTTWEKIQREYI